MTPPWALQIASDLKRDGLAVELLDQSRDVVAEVFRCDADKTVKVNLFRQDVPDVIVRELIEEAMGRLGTFEDGTPLPVNIEVSGNDQQGMPISPDHHSTGDARNERTAKLVSDWLVTLSFLASGGIWLKAAIVSSGIIDDEKVTVIGMLVIASALLVSSVVANLKGRRIGNLIGSAVSCSMLVSAFVLVARGWR